MKRTHTLVIFFIFFSCDEIRIGVEEVVDVELPSATNLITVEGWVTSNVENQYIRITRTNSFNSLSPVEQIMNASVIVQSRTGQTFPYTYSQQGIYLSDEQFSATPGGEYRVRIQLADEREIRSDWELMPNIVALNRLFVDFFEENDPENPNQQITIYFPRMIALDPEGDANYYRWRFFKNEVLFIEPESITIQDDRFFNGNLIPNNFRSFNYDVGDEIVVQFQSIGSETYNYLNLLKSQITSLGTSSGTTPAQVDGNLFYLSTEEEESVLGFFGLAAVSSDTIIVVE